MSEEIVKEVVAKVEEMAESGEEFEDRTLQDFATTIDYLLKERSRKEEVLALAAAVFALDEYHVTVKDTTRCNACRVCLKVCPEVEITTEDDDFLFMIEFNGHQPAYDIFLRAVDALKSKANEFADKI